MEKEHFKDRPIESTQINHVKIGDEVLICEKQAQIYAKKISDLTYGVVVEVLTQHDHPRGIKVKVETLNNKIAVGRIVYIL